MLPPIMMLYHALLHYWIMLLYIMCSSIVLFGCPERVDLLCIRSVQNLVDLVVFSLMFLLGRCCLLSCIMSEFNFRGSCEILEI